MTYRDIYDKVRDVHTVDLLGAPRKWTGKVTNATELMFDSQKLWMTYSFADDAGKNLDKMSDYERFLLFVSNLKNMAGSGVRELFETELSMLLGDIKIDAEIIWNKVADSLEKSGYDAAKLISDSGVVQLDIDGIYEIALRRRYSKSYLDYIDEIAFELASAPYDTAYFDMSDLNFVRTDVFHCEEAYKHFAACRDYNKEYIDMLSSGILYSACENLKKENRALWLYVGDNIIDAERMLRYFSDRGVLPRVYVVLSESSAKLGASKICRVEGVSPAIAYEMGDTADRIANKVFELASVYPISLVRYGGIFGNVALPEAAHEIVKKGICIALSKICDDVEVACDIFCAIYKNISAQYSSVV